jgi:hypothetical protein
VSKPRLIILLIGVLTISISLTGCISPAGNKTTNVQFSVTSPSSLQYETFCPPTNETPFIIINPIDRHFFGETFEINGTTNLGGNEKLHYSVSSPDVVSAMSCPTGSSSCPKSIIKGSHNITYGEFFVRENGDEPKQWTFLLNSTGLDFKSNYSVSFILDITSQNLTLTNNTDFMVLHHYSNRK